MATSATPTGAEPVGTLSASGSFTGKIRHIKIASGYGTAIFYGDFVKLVSSGSTSIGRSKNALDGGSIATTNTLPLRIVDFVDGPSSTVGDAFTDCIVTYLPLSHAYETKLGV
jgi:hypothetical protein